jgi:DNA-binding response OmpR family regulator
VERTLTPHQFDTATPAILVIDREPETRDTLCEYFHRHGFAVRAADNAQSARMALGKDVPALTILDLHVAGECGLSLARWMRHTHPDMGIVMLAAAREATDRIVGIEVGADAFLPKPFDIRELLARVRAILRRLGDTRPIASGAHTPRHVRFGRCVLDLERRELKDSTGRVVQLTASDFNVLELFARHPNRPLSRELIMEQVHNRRWEIFDRSIDARIMRLRRKIERNPTKPEVLKTVRSLGYVFVAPACDSSLQT